MKINKILLGAFALSMTFASCSNDEPAKGPNEGGNTDGEKYVAVRIKSVGENGSRGAGDKYEPGVGNENALSAGKLRFYFFTSDRRPFVMNQTGVNGTVSNTNMVEPTAITVDKDNTNNGIVTDGPATEVTAILVLGTEAGGYKGNTPRYVVCIANPDGNLSFTDFANKNMSELLSETHEAPAFTNGANSTFTMTSSSYVDEVMENNERKKMHIYYTDLTGKIKGSQKEATDNPADIFLERLAAKVRVTGIKEYPSKDAEGNVAEYKVKVLSADGSDAVIKEGVKLNVQLTGWQLRNIANENYAIKRFDENWITTDPFANWNDPTYHRSYWTNPFVKTYDKLLVRTYDIAEKAGQFKLGNYDKDKPTDNLAYCYENTIQPTDKVVDGKTIPAKINRESDATAIVVRGIVKMEGETEFSAVNLCEWGGEYYTEEALKQVIINSYNQGVAADDKLTRDKVEFEKFTNQLPNLDGKKVKSNCWYAYVKRADGTTVHNSYRFNNIQRWVAGETSFYVNIEHIGGKFGVVRNHIYDYTFDGVIGLGIPGNDPKNPDPQTETYLAARVYVLNWRLVSNTITLQ